MKVIKLIFWIILAGLASCREKNGNSGHEPIAGLIFADYKISAEEGSDTVTILLQFRDESRDEENIGFENGGLLRFDGESLEAGHSKMLGIYYETRKPLAGFTGKHTIEFTDRDHHKHQETFNFETLILQEEVPDTLEAGNLELHFAPLTGKNSQFRIVLTDTSYLGNGISHACEVKNNTVIIPASEMIMLHKGPVMLQCYLEDERESGDTGLAGGIISVTYGLKRRFFLK